MSMVARLERRLRCSRRGSVAIMTALSAVPIIAFAGLAIDASRAWLVQSRLQAALDSAVLTAAREAQTNTSVDDSIQLFYANFTTATVANGVGYLGSSVTKPTITYPTGNTVTMTASASLGVTFMSVLGFQTMTISGTATAMTQTTGLEVALVLDNTGSMAGAPIQGVVSSATQLVNTLYGSTADVLPNLWVSVVPFTAEVNIGKTNTSWLATGSYNASNYASAGWKGCVMARVAGGNDATDATPSQAPFTPYLWPSTLGKYKANGVVVPGDNDWSTNNITEQNQSNLGNAAVGPNLGCPTLPILPETASRTTVLNTINQMVATYRGGTFINLGLQAGWWTISPNWQGLWGSSTLPLAYDTPLMRKVIVLMTDGNNTWYDYPNGAPGQLVNGNGQVPPGYVNDGDTDFSAYGRLNMNLMGLTSATQANVTSTLNARMSAMCETIKKKGITIYTILFNHDAISTDTQALFQSCASTPQNYFLAPTNAQLVSAFSQIGVQLSNLRITQ